MGRLGFAVFLAATAALGGGRAHAIRPAEPTVIPAPVPSEPVALRVSSEQVRVSCADGDLLDCHITSTHVYANPGADPVTLSLVVSEHARAAPLSAHVDGIPRALRNGWVASFVVPAGGEARLELERDVHFNADYARFFYLLAAVVTRHPLFGQMPYPPHAPGLTFARSSREHFTEGVGHMTVAVQPPAEWSIYLAGIRSGPGELARTRTNTGSAEFVAAQLSPPERVLHHGGPFLGIGGTFHQGVHARLGYEFGIQELLLASLTLETDFDEEVTVTPMFEGALPGIFVLPSLGLGIGVPVRLLPAPRPGFRLQLTASLFVSYVVSFDYFPADDEGFRVTMLGQVGL